MSVLDALGNTGLGIVACISICVGLILCFRGHRYVAVCSLWVGFTVCFTAVAWATSKLALPDHIALALSAAAGILGGGIAACAIKSGKYVIGTALSILLLLLWVASGIQVHLGNWLILALCCLFYH